MKKKLVVRLSEQDLTNLILKSILGGEGSDLFSSLTSNKTEKEPSKPITNTAGEFQELDLTTPEGFQAYEEIADKFISSRSSNLLGLNGRMFANAAKEAFLKHKKYVPVELAMAQLAAEGGFSKNPNARPITTKNPFNVGNVDSGANVFHGSVQSGINTYYDLIARNYLVGSKTASDLIRNFVNKNGNRYATAGDYEAAVGKIANQVKSMGAPVYASISKKTDTGLA